jgi:hypothetical protein
MGGDAASAGAVAAFVSGAVSAILKGTVSAILKGFAAGGCGGACSYKNRLGISAYLARKSFVGLSTTEIAKVRDQPAVMRRCLHSCGQ